MSSWPDVCFWCSVCYCFSAGTGRTQSTAVRIEGDSRSIFAPQRVQNRTQKGARDTCQMWVVCGESFESMIFKEFSFRSECDQPVPPQEGHSVDSSPDILLNNSIWRAPKGARWSDRRRIWSEKRHPIRAQPSAFRAHCCPLRSANRWFFSRKTDDSMV